MEEWSTKIRDTGTYTDSTSTEENKRKEEDDLKAVVETYFVPYVQGTTYKFTTAVDYGYSEGVYTANGNKIFGSTKQRPIMSLPNGSIVIFNTLKYKGIVDQTEIRTPPIGLLMYVDINGLKKPNVFGKDIFPFAIYYDSKTKLSVYGKITIITKGADNLEARKNAFQNGNYSYVSIVSSEWTNDCYNGTGSYCGVLIMTNSWKIPKNYPWL